MTEWRNPQVPTSDEWTARTDLLPGIRATGIILIQHGLNPYEIPATDDALTEQGWLRMTGQMNEARNDFIYIREPWPDPVIWRQLEPHMAEARRNLRNEF